MLSKVKRLVETTAQKANNEKIAGLRPAIFKGLIFGLGLLTLELYEFSFFMSLGFILLAIILYFNPLFNSRRLFFTFSALVIFAFALPAKFAVVAPEARSIYIQMAFAAFFGLLFYFLIGIKQLIFINRKKVYYFLYLSSLYMGLLLYFGAEKTNAFSGFIKLFLLIFFLLLMIREFFRVNNHPKNRFFTTTIFSLTLVNVELAWAITLLPIEFSSLASLATLFTFLSTEIMRRYLQEGLSAQFLRYSLVSLVLLCAVILSFSSWRP